VSIICDRQIFALCEAGMAFSALHESQERLRLKVTKKPVLPNPFSSSGYGAVWVRFGVSGYWRGWFLKKNTVFYLNSCFDTESNAINAAANCYGMASD